MNNTREYKIIINGVEQSIKAVDALLQKIDALDERIIEDILHEGAVVD